MRDEQVLEFMQTVYDIGQHYDGTAEAEQIMLRMGLEPSDVTNIDNPTTDDDRLYRDLVRYCEKRHFIKKSADRYVSVRITEEGKQYVESGLMEL